MNLEELERDMLRGARRELAAAASDRERHEAELLLRLGAGGRSEPAALGVRGRLAGAAGLGRAASPVGGSRLGMLGVGLLVGAIVGGWFGFGLGRGGWSSEPRAPSAASGAAPLALDRAMDEAGRVAPPAAVSNDPVTLEGEAEASEPLRAPEASAAAEGAGRVSNELERVPRGAPARSRPAHTPVPSASTESSIAAELALLQRARRALAVENGQLALGIVEELDERFPKGVLLEERMAIRVLSLCKLERVAEAGQSALRFFERYPGSVYAERVRQSCAGPAPE